jgi:O-6-methylguanine DNA methyltransferase
MPNVIFYTFLDSGIGTIGLASSSSGIVYVDMGIKERAFLYKLKRKFPACKLIKSQNKNAKAMCELKSYLKGDLKSFDSRLNLTGSPFQIKVWNYLKKIPYGKMRSYKFIACKTATYSHSRAVGNAIAKNPVAIFIPCHRVINSDGNLGNYGPGKKFKKVLLKIEKAI